MRKRQAKHEKQLRSIEGAAPAEVIRRIGVQDYHAADFLESEVLASLIRNRLYVSDGVVTAAVEVLNKRIQLLVRKRLICNPSWWGMEDRGSTVKEDTIAYVWDNLLEDKGISNSEVYFAVFVRERVDDYMRHLLSEKNDMDSIDSMSVKDKDGKETPLIDFVEDYDETPEEFVIRNLESGSLHSLLLSLPQAERNAFYFRMILEYDWQRVAELLSCSVPTARKYKNECMEKLKGVMK